MPYTPIILEPLCVQVAADGQVPTHAAEHTSEADGRRNTMFSGGLNGCMVEKRHILSHSSWIFMVLFTIVTIGFLKLIFYSLWLIYGFHHGFHRKNTHKNIP